MTRRANPSICSLTMSGCKDERTLGANDVPMLRNAMTGRRMMDSGLSGGAVRRRAIAAAAAIGFVVAASGVLPAMVAAAPVTVGYRDFSYTGTTAPTGEKPQSKLWVND